MLSTSLLGLAVLAVPLCNANPIAAIPPVYVERSSSDLALREAMNMAARDASLQKRVDTSVDLAQSLDDYTIIKGSWVETVDGINNTVSVGLTCIECSTTGTVSAKIMDNILKPKLRLDFSGVGAYIDLGVNVNDKATYTYTIFSSNTPVGISLDDVSLGLVFYVDLVLSLSAEVDLEGGFSVQVGNGSYIEADILEGKVANSLFTGTTVKAVPITINSGDATFKADLRLRVEAGASADILGVGLNAELGIYANILEFIVEAENTAACDVLLSETWDINAGAFLDADVVINYSTFGAVPTISTTLYKGPTATQCLGTVSSATAIVTATASASSKAHTNATATAVVVDAVRLAVGAPTDSAVSFSASVYASGSGVAFSPVPASVPASVAYSSSVAFSSVTASPASSAVSVGGLARLFANTTASIAAYSSSLSSSASAAATSVALGSNSTTLTSTIFATSTYTITSCAASVVNCPASLQNKIIVTDVVTKTVAICPEASTTVTLSSTSVPVAKTTTASAAAATGTMVVVTDVYVLVPCETPVVATFTAPTAVTSVSISVIGAIASSVSVSAPAVVAEKQTATVFPVLTTGGAFYGNGSSAKAVLAVGNVGSTAVVLPTGSAAVFVSAPGSATVGIAAPSSVAVAEAASLGVTAGAESVSASTASPTTTSAQSAVTAVVTAAAGRVVAGSFAAVVGAVFGALLL